MVVIPPYLAKELQHKLCRHKLKRCRAHASERKESKKIVLNRLKNRECNKHTKAVNHAERELCKAPVLPMFKLYSDDNALHRPAKKAVDKKPYGKLPQRHVPKNYAAHGVPPIVC
jgi:hypothetical protein